MKNLIKLGFLSTVLMLSFNSFAGPVSAYACKVGDKSEACNQKGTGVGVHAGAAAATGLLGVH